MKKEHCPYCLGTKKIQTDVFDADSGQMMRGVGEEDCLCVEKEEAPD